MTISEVEFMEALSDGDSGQREWLLNHLTVTVNGRVQSFTVPEVIERFSSGNDAEQPWMIFQEFRRYVEGLPSQRQEWNLGRLIDLFAARAGVNIPQVATGLTSDQRTDAIAAREEARCAFLESWPNQRLCSMEDYALAASDRQITSQLIKRLDPVATKLGLQRPGGSSSSSPVTSSPVPSPDNVVGTPTVDWMHVDKRQVIEAAVGLGWDPTEKLTDLRKRLADREGNKPFSS